MGTEGTVVNAISSASDGWRQFCLNTSLHGWKFTVSRDRPNFERWLWFGASFLSLIVGIGLCLSAWFDFRSSPTVLLAHSTNYAIYKFQFPAVTICNFNRISKKKAFDLANNMSSPYSVNVEEVARSLRLVQGGAVDGDGDVDGWPYAKLQNLLEYNRLSVGEAARRLAAPCADLLDRCLWKNQPLDCARLFRFVPTATARGYCCSFNYFPSPGNHADANATATTTKRSPPENVRRVTSCGFETGLEVWLRNTDPNDTFAGSAAGNIPSLGYTVAIHGPYEYPDENVETVLVASGTLEDVAVDPSVVTASDNIGEIPFSWRRCRHAHERRLLHFHTYNFHNCMLECRINITAHFCGCVPFYLPQSQYWRIKELYSYITARLDFQIRTCNLRDVQCLNKYNAQILDTGLQLEMKDICKCEADCEYTQYVAAVTFGKINMDYYRAMHDKVRNQEISIIRVFFNDIVGKQYIRDVIFDWHNLLAYFGGILGLLVGFSLVCLLEIVYFLCIAITFQYLQGKGKGTEKNNKNIVTIEHVKVKPYKFLEKAEQVTIKHQPRRGGAPQIWNIYIE